jgi:dTDP-glucose 4,6-dehydratase
LDPRSPYSSSKASSDLIALSYKSTYGLDITVTRCCNNYGERQFDEKFIPTILKHIVEKKQIPVYGNGQNVREWIYVKDHAKALLEVLFSNKPEDVYNIFGTERLSNLQLINVITDIVEDVYPMYKQQNYIKFVEDRKGHDFCYMIGTIHDNEIDALYSQQDFYASLEKVVRFYADKFTSQKYKTNSCTIV